MSELELLNANNQEHAKQAADALAWIDAALDQSVARGLDGDEYLLDELRAQVRGISSYRRSSEVKNIIKFVSRLKGQRERFNDELGLSDPVNQEYLGKQLGINPDVVVVQRQMVLDLMRQELSPEERKQLYNEWESENYRQQTDYYNGDYGRPEQGTYDDAHQF